MRFLFLFNAHRCVGVERHIGGVAVYKFKIALRSDHCAVIAAVFKLGSVKLPAVPFAQSFHISAKHGVCRNSACKHDLFVPEILCRLFRVLGQASDDRLDVGSTEIRNVNFLSLLLCDVYCVKSGGF